MTVESIKTAIANLPLDQRHSLANWLNGLDNDDWDRQMAEDFSPEGATGIIPLVTFRHKASLVRSPCPVQF